MASPFDKRRWRRFLAPRLSIRLPGIDPLRVHPLKDISEGGLYFYAHRSFAVGEDILIELCGETDPLRLAGRVVRSTTEPGNLRGIAITLIGLTDDVMQQLKAVLQRYAGAAAPLESTVWLGASLSRADFEQRILQLTLELAKTREQLEAVSAEARALKWEVTELRRLAETREE